LVFSPTLNSTEWAVFDVLVNLKSPLTSRAARGAFVPIPTLEEVTREVVGLVNCTVWAVVFPDTVVDWRVAADWIWTDPTVMPSA
jgi:hypothetical protein